jgi:DNA-directed RNA polymerase specialized sigma24 family protein
LVERARGKGRIKRGGDWRRVDLEDLALAVSAPTDLLLTLDEAITGLEAEDPAAAALVRLHYYAGLPLEQAGASLGISTATTYRHWAYARAWLACALLDDRG